ncbi:MAG: hypothetical protein JSR11_03605 [Bacteroidetes bacterium]|nr:hypothetical protein [Bacteroidota bacterium]
MFKVDSNITVGDYEFDFAVDIEIENNIDSLTDTCKLTLPRKFEWNLQTIALGDDPILKRKDYVVVKYGYDGNLITEFIGFVKDIKPGTPVTIECEDYMFLLKQKPITTTFKAGTTLKQLLNVVIPKTVDGYKVEFKTLDDNIQVGEWRINNCTPARVLEELQKKFGLYSYFRLIPENNVVKPVLYVGWAYWIDGRKQDDFEFGYNIINSSDLVYKRAEDVRLKVKAISINEKNKRQEIEIGDGDGELRTVHYYKVDVATLKARAKKDLEKFKYSGYHGTFITFGEPSLQKCDVCSLTGNKYHPSGKYLTKKIVKKLSVTGGIRQTIEPNKQVNNLSTET